MIVTWQNIMRTIIVVAIGRSIFGDQLTAYPSDWRVIEILAEEHPYIVALLNVNRQYVCTGITINKRTVLTSGHCVEAKPNYIAVATAVIVESEEAMTHNIIEVAATVVHNEYTFDIKPTEPNITRLHSNMGLVFAVRPVLMFFLESADIANYYASELREKRLTVVGYGGLYSGTIALQQQAYNQTPCSNPKWYYCVCGLEDAADQMTYDREFGEGAPVLLDTKVVAIAATPSGSLIEPTVGVKYSIFTVIGPYLSWIEKRQIDTTFKLHALINSSDTHTEVLIKYILILLLITILINDSSV